MHATERDQVILELLNRRGFISFRDLSAQLSASPATLRRDMHRLQEDGKLVRVRGGAQSVSGKPAGNGLYAGGMSVSKTRVAHLAEKTAIARAAVALCRPGEAIVLDGGTTTRQMCPHLETLNLQVMTNSLPIISALLPQTSTSISIPGGTVFREQNIMLNPYDDAAIGFHAAQMFIGCAAISRFGIMQHDILLIQAERRLLSLADEVVVLADSSKFSASAPHSLCPLSGMHTLITDSGAPADRVARLRDIGVRVIVVNPPGENG